MELCDGSDFCSELAVDSSSDTEFFRTYRGNPPTRLLAETENLAVLADLSPLTAGHVLVVPRRHYLSFASVLGDHLDETVALLDRLLPVYRQEFGEPTILEHGSSKADARASACVAHAHLHVLPIDGDAVEDIWRRDGLIPKELRGWSGLSQRGGEDSSYFFCHSRGRATLYRPPGAMPSQYLRKSAGAVIGLAEEECDWAVVVRADVHRETVRRLTEHLGQAHSPHESDQHRTTSDEPTRLRDLVALGFGRQTGFTVTLQSGATATLLAGADKQDDCAVFAFDGNVDLVVGSDYVRGPKFALYERGFLDEYDLGWYLTAANFSDVAAMGARPLALLSIVRYPPTMTDSEFQSVLAGIRAGCESVGAPNVGGDIGSAERLILAGTALGLVDPGRSLRRDGARPGDLICITGPTGVAGSALRYFTSDDRGPIAAEHEEALLASWRRPRARVQEGVLLGLSRGVTACIDTSDGLNGALGLIAAQSGVGLEIRETSVPVTAAVVAVAEALGKQVLDLVFGDSVDFQLVATIRPDMFEAIQAQFTAQDLALHAIGVVTEDTTVALVDAVGSRHALPGEPWRHTW